MLIFKWFYSYSYIRRWYLKIDAIILVETYIYVRVIGLVESYVYCEFIGL